MPEASVAEIARAIADYVGNNPQAQDTLEGIIQWWLPEVEHKPRVAVIRQALDELVAGGLITAHKAKDAQILYRAARGTPESDATPKNPSQVGKHEGGRLMPATVTYPGVYIEEVPSGVHTISGVATSITAFVGYTSRGLDNRAKHIFSFADFERSFGGLAADSELSYAVQQFFSNGGTEAYVVRVPKASDAAVQAPDVKSAAATITLLDNVAAGKQALLFTALSKGAWANNVIIDVDYDGLSDAKAFNLTITDLETLAVETFSNVTMDSTKANYVVAVVNDEDTGSQMVSVSVPDATAGRPVQTGTVGGDIPDITVLAVPSSIKISADVPTGAPGPISNIEVKFLETGEAKPGSVLGISRQLERKINVALQAANVTGATVQCVPSNTGKGVRILANFSRDLIPGALDARLTFSAGAPSALGTLKLSAGVVENVAHYVMGS